MRHRLLYSSILLLLAGCTWRSAEPNPVGNDRAAGGTDAVLSVIDGWAAWSAWAGAAVCVLAGLALFLAPPVYRGRAWQALVAGGVLIASGYALAFVAANSWLIISAIIGCGLVAGWAGRHYIEKFTGVDLDQDGHVGTPPSPKDLEHG